MTTSLPRRLVPAAALLCATAPGALAEPVPIGADASTYNENFDTLPASGTGLTLDTLPLGWTFVEGGSNGNETYQAGTGSSSTGDTYSFGANGSSDRALGGLASNNLTTTVGGWFENASDAPIRSLSVRYAGEQWRAGATARSDVMEFDFGLTPTALTNSLNAEGWLRSPWLDLRGPLAATTGAKVGNDDANRVIIEHTLVGLDLAPGETFFFRWRDINVSGSDDALGIDDFSLELNPTSAPEVDFVKESRTPGTTLPTSGSAVEVDLYLEHASAAPVAPMTQIIVTDTLPPGFTVDPEGFALDLDGDVFALTPADDDDAGEIVDGLVTVRIDELSPGSAVLVSYRGTLGAVLSDRTFSTLATASFATLDPAMTYSAYAPDALDVLATGSARFVFFFDANGNGVQEDDEEGLPGFDVSATGTDVVTSGDDGVVSLTGLSPGTLALLVEAPDAEGAWSFSAPDTFDVVADAETSITVAVTCSCNDDDVCTTTDRCDRGACFFEDPLDCGDDDEDPCTEAVCDPVDGCGTVFTTETCDDGDPATRDDTCDGAGTCEGDAYTCTPGSCEVSSTPNGVDCDVIRAETGAGCNDGDDTTRNDVCPLEGACAGTPYTCDTSTEPCVMIVQDGDGCVTTPINAGDNCDDGDDATRADVCDAEGACAGTPYTCDETPSPCTTAVPNGDTCDTVPANVGGACDDGDAATRQDVCGDDGSCAGTPFTCDETPSPCTTAVPNGDSCDTVPTNLGGACDDGDSGTRADACLADGGCAGTPFTCDETPSPCTTAVPNGDTCDTVPTNAGGACDDGDAATREDVCTATGSCAGTPFTCDETPSPCTTAVPNGDSCDTVPTNAGGACDDGDNGTRQDVCDDAGQCAGVTYECPATDNPCTSNVQDGADCVEQPANDAASCDDEDPGTRDDVCAAGECAGTAFTCTPAACEASSTPNGATCDVTFEAAGTGCDDGEADTRDDVCDGAGACAGTPFTCEPGPCEVSSVPNGTGCDVTFAEAGTSCDDSNACTSDDACTEGGLCAGTAVTCEAGEVCDIDGECAATHCTACEADAECGEGATCVDLGGETGRVCLVDCDEEVTCGEAQACAAFGEGEAAGSFCFDAEGACAAPPVEPGPDADPVEPGPEQPAADEGPEVVEGGPDAAPEAGPQVAGGGGCGGGAAGDEAGFLLLAALGLGGLALRRRRAVAAR